MMTVASCAATGIATHVGRGYGHNTTDARLLAITETARSHLGKPYVYAGSGKRGFDCSGFVRAVYGTHGYTLPRTSRDQARTGTRVEWSNITAGDLLFFTDRPGSKRVNHVGIALDPHHMIHASTGRHRIVIDPLDMDYYRRRLFAVRRIVGD
ncbi:MAG: C40 family peptidase [Myxococcota bacterium]